MVSTGFPGTVLPTITGTISSGNIASSNFNTITVIGIETALIRYEVGLLDDYIDLAITLKPSSAYTIGDEFNITLPYLMAPSQAKTLTTTGNYAENSFASPFSVVLHPNNVMCVSVTSIPLTREVTFYIGDGNMLLLNTSTTPSPNSHTITANVNKVGFLA